MSDSDFNVRENKLLIVKMKLKASSPNGQLPVEDYRRLKQSIARVMTANNAEKSKQS